VVVVVVVVVVVSSFESRAFLRLWMLLLARVRRARACPHARYALRSLPNPSPRPAPTPSRPNRFCPTPLSLPVSLSLACLSPSLPLSRANLTHTHVHTHAQNQCMHRWAALIASIVFLGMVSPVVKNQLEIIKATVANQSIGDLVALGFASIVELIASSVRGRPADSSTGMSVGSRVGFHHGLCTMACRLAVRFLWQRRRRRQQQQQAVASMVMLQ
jgi:hypothetical protein